MNLEENKNIITTDKKKLQKYIPLALVVFVTFCCCTLFFFFIYRYHGFTSYWGKLWAILQPITIGVVLAYLLNPVMRFLEKYLLKLFLPRTRKPQQARQAARWIAIVGALLFFLGVCVAFFSIVVPSTMNSIQRTIAELSAGDEVDALLAWADEFINADTELAALGRQIVESATAWLQNFLEDFVSFARTYVSSIISGVIYSVKLVINIVVGIIVSAYVMASKEKFAAQTKKIVYAFCKPAVANVMVETVRKIHEIFGGFISGKILDSAIIGVIAYVVLVIMKMPDALLLAVIIGVTNVIPFFGPFIGAIPCFVIVVLQDPWQGIYFLIFILILQQIDGNIIGPKILGDSTGLSSFWVVFAILLFGGLWGFTGMLLGVPIMAVVYYLVSRIVNYYLAKRGLSRETDCYADLRHVDEDSNQMVFAPEEMPKAADSKAAGHKETAPKEAGAKEAAPKEAGPKEAGPKEAVHKGIKRRGMQRTDKES